MKTLSEIRGHEWIVAALQRDLIDDRCAAAYLFAGREGVGKRSLAEAFLSVLLCTDRKGEARACGRCASCRAVQQGRHVDWITVRPAPGSSRLDLARVRSEVVEAFEVAPRVAGRQVVLIDGAETLSPESQNVLLKTLEEPPPHACLILVATTETAFLPTVLSRCRVFRFGRLGDAECAAVLEAEGAGAADPGRVGSALELADGSPGEAMRWLASSQLEARELLGEWIREGAPSVAELRELVPGLEGGAGGDRNPAQRRERLRELWRLVLAVCGVELRADPALVAGAEPATPNYRAWADGTWAALEDLERMVTPELCFELWAAALPRP